MKIVLWIGNKSNQRALANKIHSVYPISGIILENKNVKTEVTLSKVIEKLFLSPISNAWKGMQEHFDSKYPRYPDTKMLTVQNINSDEAYSFTREMAPDLIIVSGTRLIRQKMLSIKPSIGILNLHTGLSPYVKGGPNSTNWCIANQDFHMIGNTIMWIDPGIDTGNIVTTEHTDFTGDESLLDIHIKVMEHGHDLYLKAIDKLVKGVQSNVNQDTIAKGTTYVNKQWGLKEKFALVRNFKKFKQAIQSPDYSKKKESIKTVRI